MSFCSKCGKEVSKDAEFCDSCGGSLSNESPVTTSTNQPIQDEPKEWLVTLLLSFFLGLLGIHRFYLGYTLIGIIQLLTFGGFLIWVIADLIRLTIVSLKDSENNDLA